MTLRLRPLLVLFSFGCVPESVAVQIPDATEIHSMIVAIDNGRSFTLEASGVQNGLPDEPLLRAFERETRVTLLYYRSTLDEIGLESGPIALGSDRPLPKHDRAFASQVDLDGAGEWETLGVLPEELATISLPFAKNACRPFEVIPLDLVPGNDRALSVPLDDRNALLVYNDAGRMFLIDAAGASEEVPAPAGFYPLGAHLAAGGIVWFSWNDMLLPWSRADGFGAPIRHDRGLEIGTIDGARGDAPFELFSMGWNGELEHFDGVRFTRLATGAQNPLFGGAGLGIAWNAPGESIAVVRDSPQIFHTHRAPSGEIVATESMWTWFENGLMSTVSYVEGFGVVLASRPGRFYVPGAGTEWRELPYGPFETALGTGRINALARVAPRGFIFAGLADFLGEYDQEGGLCDELDIDLDLDVRTIAPVGDSFLLAGTSTATPPRPIAAIVRRRR